MLACCLAAAGAWSGGPFGVAVSGGVAILAVLLGCGIGRRWGPFPARIHRLLFRIADELAQYRAFTRLLRNQGLRITRATADAAQVIVLGLREMDESLTGLAAELDQLAAENALEQSRLATLAQKIQAAGGPLVAMLGSLQFQDVTQQQVDFLSRLSLLVDQHMQDLAYLCGDRRSLDRVGKFKELFDAALDDTVMASQRDDHHDAAGVDLRESAGPSIELF